MWENVAENNFTLFSWINKNSKMIRWLFRKSEELSQELPKDWYRTIINEINDCYTKENDDDDDGKIKETSYGIDRREFGIYLGKLYKKNQKRFYNKKIISMTCWF